MVRISGPSGGADGDESKDLSQLQHRQDMPPLEDPPQLHAPGRIIFLAAASAGAPPEVLTFHHRRPVCAWCIP